MLCPRRLALGLLLLPVPALAQFEVSSIADPIRPERAPLAITEEVPAIFWLGLDSPASVFVNPARAARSKDRFAYGTIRPDFSTEAPVSFAGLFGRGDRRWLVTAENGVSTVNRDETQTSVDRQDDPNFSLLQTSERTSENETVATSTRARAVFVSRTDFGGIAFGLYGGYRSAGLRFAFDDEREQTVEQTTPVREDRNRDQNQSLQRADADAFGVGAELAFAGRTWDLAAAVSYQQLAADAEQTASRFNLNETEGVDFDGTPFERLDRYEETSRAAAEGTPRAVDVELVGALRTGRKRDDYLFGSVAGTFGSGTADAASSFESERFSRTLNGGVETETLDQTSEARDAEADLETRATHVSVGYVYAQRHRGLTILAAINPLGGFRHTESLALDGSARAGLTRRDRDETVLALTLPLYVRFDVTKRLDAFGGGAYTYAYSRLDTESRLVPLDTVPADGTEERTTEQTTEIFSSSGLLYAGAVFSFRSGLRAQASLNGTLSEITRWTVSLGYHF